MTKKVSVWLGVALLCLFLFIETKPAVKTSSMKTLGSRTVMITNMAKNSGGTGSIVVSTPSFSRILTNGHVCNVAKNGGYAITDDGVPHLIAAYRESAIHDLCLLEVSEDLHIQNALAEHAPEKYEPAAIVGHPHLLPTVITKGFFSGKQSISVFIGIRECTKEEQDSTDTGLFCVLAGGMPIIKTYEAILVSATIMPGSSGSSIYNEAGEISAVVFAGSGDLGYAFAVPYEFVRTFLEHEVFGIDTVIPNLDANSAKGSSRSESKEKFTKACKNAYTKYHHKVCKIVSASI